jgi:hypothetical protein
MQWFCKIFLERFGRDAGKYGDLSPFFKIQFTAIAVLFLPENRARKRKRAAEGPPFLAVSVRRAQAAFFVCGAKRP